MEILWLFSEWARCVLQDYLHNNFILLINSHSWSCQKWFGASEREGLEGIDYLVVLLNLEAWNLAFVCKIENK